jgi:hypothetical protein
MPRVIHIQHARKPIESIGVKVGDSYYKWRMKTATSSVKRVSKTPPRPSQLTLSEFKSSWRSFSEEIDDLELDDSLHDNLMEIAGRIRELGDEQYDKLQNMPESLQSSASGELLSTRQDNCNTWADEIEGLEKPDEQNEMDVRESTERADHWTDEEYVEAQDKAWEEAKEEYEGNLKTLKEDAINADPGEE